MQVNEKLFPCKLSIERVELAEEAVQSAVEAWGQKSLTELEAEERLSYSSEKVNNRESWNSILISKKRAILDIDLCSFPQGPVQDEVIGKLRNAFLEISKEYKGYTDEERKKVGSVIAEQYVNLCKKVSAVDLFLS